MVVNIPGNLKGVNDLNIADTEVAFVIGGGVLGALIDLKLQGGNWVVFLRGA